MKKEKWIVFEAIYAKKMNKTKKIVIVFMIIFLILGIVFGVTFLLSRNSESKEELNVTVASSLKSTLAKIYEKMLQKETYTFSFILDDNNKKIIARNGDTARIDIYEDGKHTTDIIKEGATYSLVHEKKEYYEYISNTIQLTNLLKKMERLKGKEKIARGEEEIEGNTYTYEEYQGTAEFLMKHAGENTEQATTKVYFNQDTLVYIKTILENREELLKVEMSYATEGISLEIPEDYQLIEI